MRSRLKKQGADLNLSIIIVNWNTRELLRDCMRSISSYQLACDYEVFVVDNASSDGSVAMVAQEFPQVHVIENAENVGFAKANNQAIAKASGDYVLLLNPDTIVTPGSLDKLLACAKASPAAGVIGGKTLNRDGSIDYGCARHFPTIGGEFFNITRLNAAFPKNRIIGHYRMSYWDHNDTREVDCVIGACMLLKHEMLEKIGYLDESYFMYVEDIEISYRAKTHGYKTVYCAGAQIYHFGAESSKQARRSMRLTGIKSMYIYLIRTRGRSYAMGYLAMLPFAIGINRVGEVLKRIRGKS